jgi:DNA repair exonuclease SbcCD nuclease subunit
MPSNKVALICDTHYGVRGDNPALYSHFGKFFENVFFPTIDKYDIDRIIHLGDLVDRRKFINFTTARELFRQFISPITARNIRLDILVGNHDVAYKNTNSINALDTLNLMLYPNIVTYISPETVDVKGTPILFLPWINKENSIATLNAIDETNAQIALGHLELNGFEMYKGSVCDEGMDSKVLSRFDMVCSGHFHHKSSIGNVHYLGAPYEMTWMDYNDPRGFHILDLDTREIEFIQNPHRLFHKIYYDDIAFHAEDILNKDFAEYNNTFVKVIIKNKNTPSLFDSFIDSIEKVSPVDLQVVEDHLNLDLEVEQDIIDEAEDTLTILNKFVDTLNTKTSKADIKKVLYTLYTEALNVEGS